MPNGQEQQVVPGQQQGVPEDPNTPYAAIDPKQNPVAFIYQNRDALSQMDPEKAVRGLTRVFNRYMLPKYKAANPQGLSPQEMMKLKTAFIARMTGVGSGQTPEMGTIEKKPGIARRAGAAVLGTTAGALGNIRQLSELVSKIDKEDLGKDPIHQAISKTEGALFGKAVELSPGTASLTAGVGHELPALAGGEMAAKAVPEALAPGIGQKVPAMMQAASQMGKGIVGGATFGALRPGADPQREAMIWGMMGAAFPLLGRMFGLGRRGAAAAEEAVATKPGIVATASPESAKSVQELSELSTKAKTQKEEIDAARKAKIAAAKAKKQGKPPEATPGTPTPKPPGTLPSGPSPAAQAAEAQAQQQAQARASGAPVATQATAEAAKVENPQVGKAIGTFTPERRVAEGVAPGGAERRKTLMKGVTTAFDMPTAGEKLEKELKQTAEGKVKRLTPKEAEERIKADPIKAKLWETLKPGSKERDTMLITEQREHMGGPKEAPPEVKYTQVEQALLKRDTTKGHYPGMTYTKEGIKNRFRVHEEGFSKLKERGAIINVGEGRYRIGSEKDLPMGEAKPVEATKETKKKAADAARIAQKRATGQLGTEVSGGGLAEEMTKKLDAMKGMFKSPSIGVQHIPELEEHMKEFEGGEFLQKELAKRRKQGVLTDEMYAHEMKEWMVEQLGEEK